MVQKNVVTRLIILIATSNMRITSDTSSRIYIYKSRVQQDVQSTYNFEHIKSDVKLGSFNWGFRWLQCVFLESWFSRTSFKKENFVEGKLGGTLFFCVKEKVIYTVYHIQLRIFFGILIYSIFMLKSSPKHAYFFRRHNFLNHNSINFSKEMLFD